MKKRIVMGLIVGSLILASTAALLQWRTATNQASRIFLDPASSVIGSGDEVQVTVRMTSREPIDTVMAKLRFDKNVVTYKSVNYNTKDLGSNIPFIIKDDTVMLQAAKLGGQVVTGDITIATVIFTGTKASSAEFELIDANAARAGEATNPVFKKASVQPIVLALVGGAVGLLIVAVMVGIRRRAA